MKKYLMVLLCIALPAKILPLQAQTFGNNGFVVGQIIADGVAANACWGYFETDKTFAYGSISYIATDGSISGLEKITDNQSSIFTVKGNVVCINTPQLEEDIMILTVDGRNIYKGNSTTIRLKQGVYLLYINKKTSKIIIN